MENKLKEIEVFADHMSSGLWYKGVNIGTEDTNITPELKLALKYWHEMWEFGIAEGKLSDRYVKRWNKDGATLVQLFNSHCNEWGIQEQYIYMDSE